jgi:hypothetical protein
VYTSRPDNNIFMTFIHDFFTVLKSISASEMFEESPGVKKELWGGEFWEDGKAGKIFG